MGVGAENEKNPARWRGLEIGIRGYPLLPSNRDTLAFSKDRQMAKINGWWRVWVVGFVLLGIGFAWVGNENLPAYPYDALDYHSSRIGPLLIEKMAAVEGRTPTRPAENIQQDIDALSASLSAIVKIHNQRKLEHSLEYLGGWIACCIMLLLGIWVLRWVIAGFEVNK
jgi:hypothetical protein